MFSVEPTSVCVNAFLSVTETSLILLTIAAEDSNVAWRSNWRFYERVLATVVCWSFPHFEESQVDISEERGPTPGRERELVDISESEKLLDLGHGNKRPRTSSPPPVVYWFVCSYHNKHRKGFENNFKETSFVSDLIKTCSAVSVFYIQTDKQTDRPGEVNGLFWQNFCC